MSYREFDTQYGPFIFPTTTPVQFDPEAMHASIERLLGLNPERMYLTHYGCVENIPLLAGNLRHMIDAFVDLAREAAAVGARRQVRLVASMKDVLLKALRVHGCRLPQERIVEFLEMDLELNAQGLQIWLDKNRKVIGAE